MGVTTSYAIPWLFFLVAPQIVTRAPNNCVSIKEKKIARRADWFLADKVVGGKNIPRPCASVCVCGK